MEALLVRLGQRIHLLYPRPLCYLLEATFLHFLIGIYLVPVVLGLLFSSCILIAHKADNARISFISPNYKNANDCEKTMHESKVPPIANDRNNNRQLEM